MKVIADKTLAQVARKRMMIVNIFKRMRCLTKPLTVREGTQARTAINEYKKSCKPCHAIVAGLP